MCFPLVPRPQGAASCGELTRLNSERQFKPFIYLNASRGESGPRTFELRQTRKIPPFGGTFLLSRSSPPKLAIPLRGLALTVRILLLAGFLLLLLAGLRAAALLLTRFLTRVLVLLAGLVLVGHRRISLVERRGE